MSTEVFGFNLQMVDANQRWDVDEAITWMKALAEFKPMWIEEPTSPDDILGHATISEVNKFKNNDFYINWFISNKYIFFFKNHINVLFSIDSVSDFTSNLFRISSFIL